MPKKNILGIGDNNCRQTGVAGEGAIVDGGQGVFAYEQLSAGIGVEQAAAQRQGTRSVRLEIQTERGVETKRTLFHRARKKGEAVPLIQLHTAPVQMSIPRADASFPVA